MAFPAGDSVLLVDDEPGVLTALVKALGSGEFSVRTAGSAAEALALLHQAPSALVVAGFELPGGEDGVSLLRRVRLLWPQTQRMLLSGHADLTAIEQANLRGDINRFALKPLDAAQLRITVRSALTQHRVDVENAVLQASLEERVSARTAQLAQAKLEWERSFDAISDPFAIVSRDRIVRRANRAYAQLGARDIKAVPGLRCHEALFHHPEVCAGCPLDAAAQGESARSRIEVSGHAYRVLAYPLGSGDAVCSYRDVTLEEAVSRQLVQTEKLTATGQLAAGVAHEINNPLASIIALSQVMKAEPGRSADDLQALGLVESSALRCKKIVEMMLRFVRRPREAGQRQRLDLRSVAEEAVALMRAQLGQREVQLVLEPPGEPQVVVGDHGQLVQVLINLLQNALQAVGAKGRVRVFWGRLGRHVALSVSDDGPGVPRELRDRIFEPFFTTKPEGQGTGLGLSISHRIVEEHGGDIAFESEPGHGTTFTLLFPPVEEAQ